MYALAWKNNLGKHLTKMQKKFPSEYKFFPRTWMLPCDASDMRTYLSNVQQNNKKVTFIVKPEASCQGKGIFLTRNIADINLSEHQVV